MRRGDVDEEGAIGGEGLLGFDPLDGVVGEVFVEGVVVLAAGWRNHFDRLGFEGEFGVPLVGFAVEEAVEVVEALVGGPVIEGTGEGVLTLGDEVPLAEVGGGVSVGAKDLGDEGGGLGDRGVVAGVVGGPIGDDAHVDGVVVTACHEFGAGWGAERGDVKTGVAQAPCSEAVEGGCGDKPTKGAGLCVSGIVNEDDEDVGGSGRRVDGGGGRWGGRGIGCAYCSAKRRRSEGQNGAVGLLRGGVMLEAE